MNCEKCDTTIDYRFLTNCANCETEPTGLPTIDIHPVESVKRKHTWTRRIVNTLYILTVSMAGMFAGAAFVLFSATVAFSVFRTETDSVSHDCARGTLIGILCLLVGGFLGTVGASIFAAKHPVWKT